MTNQDVEPGAWWQRGMVTLDSETTGVDLENDRIVELCVAIIQPTAPVPEERIRARTALINPGIPVPVEASRIHGYTTERLQAEGGDPAVVLEAFTANIAAAVLSGLPLIAMNAAFDLTILDRDCRRNSVATLTDRLGDHPLAPVIDPLVIDTHVVERRRRVSATQGARQLKTLCQVWGVGWDDNLAHAAEYDALQAARLVWQVCQKNPVIAGMTLMELHTAQVGWRRTQMENLREYLFSVDKDDAAKAVNMLWPMVPAPQAVTA